MGDWGPSSSAVPTAQTCSPCEPQRVTVVVVLGIVVVAAVCLWLFSSSGAGEPNQSNGRLPRDPRTIYRDEYLSPEVEARSLVLDGNGLPTAELRRVKDRFVIVTSDGMVNPKSRSIYRLGLHAFQVRGTAHHQAAANRGDFRPGTPVHLAREPNNPHDPNAIAVFADNVYNRAGYVPKQTAARLTKLIDAGADVVAISLRGGGPRTADVVPTVLAAERHVMEHLTRNLPRD